MVVTAFFWAVLINPFFIQYENIDPTFMGYYKDYTELYKKTCSKRSILPTRITIVFEPNRADERDIAVCFRLARTTRIAVDIKNWNLYSDPQQREQIMYHELSHCMLRKHHEDSDEGNYMYPSMELLLSHPTLIKQVTNDMKEACK